MTGPALTPVQSSHIAAVGYDAPTSDLHVQFKDGNTYVYHGVPPALHQQLAKAESIGTFLHQNLRGKFKHSKLERPSTA